MLKITPRPEDDDKITITVTSPWSNTTFSFILTPVSAAIPLTQRYLDHSNHFHLAISTIVDQLLGRKPIETETEAPPPPTEPDIEGGE